MSTPAIPPPPTGYAVDPVASLPSGYTLDGASSTPKPTAPSPPSAPSMSESFGNGAASMLTPILHPIDSARATVRDFIQRHSLQGRVADPSMGDAGMLNNAIAGVQNVIQNPRQAIPNLAGKATMGALMLGLGEAIPGATAGEPSAALTSPAELAARATTKAINPPVASATNLIDSLTAEGPNIKSYAASRNLPLNGVLDYSKVAGQMGDELHGQYRSLLDPHVNEVSQVPPSYNGRRSYVSGQSQPRPGTPPIVSPAPSGAPVTTATLGDISNRISQINDLLSPAFNKPTEAASDAALARTNLMSEHSALTNILHQRLGAITQTAPEDIASLRQRIGKLNTISDLSNQSVNTRAAAEANASYGTRNVPHSASGAAFDAVKKALQGTPNQIADKSLRGALTNSYGIPTTGSSIANALQSVNPALLMNGAANAQQ